ncbi:hypothetical protein Bca52824_027956 [Brassica carinata]|uniref:Uncharacterized protein n=1 Tax=Brassica carinata TaxID=52824 RepID=A0A8X7VBD6_BRACI|nr:hypothetical protein Bca52824_027956 [Brassica carinata]
MFDCGTNGVKSQVISGHREKFVRLEYGLKITVWRFLYTSKGANVLATKQALRYIVLVQYIPRFLRMYPLSSELKRTAGVFAETAWAGAAYYLLLYMLASHWRRLCQALWRWPGQSSYDGELAHTSSARTATSRYSSPYGNESIDYDAGKSPSSV